MDTTLVALLAVPAVSVVLLLAFLCYRKYRSDSVIHNCSQGCHHKNVKTGSGIGTTTPDIASTATTTSSHGHQHKPAVKSSRGRNSGSSAASKRHEKNHTHPWLVSSLKGHTDEVRDIGFSSNGKYLASCADDNNAGHRNSTSSDLTDDVSSSSNEDLPAITSPKQAKKTQKSGRSRRQKKTHRTITMVDLDDESKENRQPANLYTTTLRKSSKIAASPLSVTNEVSSQQETTFLKVERLVKIGHFHCYISGQQEMQLVKVLNDYYIVPENDLKRYGYPVESDDGTEIFKPPFGRWIAPRKTWEDYDSNANQVSGDSGQGSSSPNSTDSETLEDEGSENNSPLYSYCDQSLAKQCDRCKRPFLVTAAGEYLTQEECAYHWGRISTMYIPHLGCVSHYMCCNGPPMSEGCTRGKAHVWSGLSFGVNGPFNDFVKTEEKNSKERQVYALDCEMCFTGLGLELAKITVVSVIGEIVYEHFVQPRAEVVDYNTRFSGITEKHLRHDSVKTLIEVQNDLLNLFSADTVLIGHGLENDLRALRLVHKKIVDTSILFPHNQGFPYKRKLKHLTRQILRREIQTDSNGHNSLEDSRACLELALWKVRKEHNFFQGVQ